MLPVFIFDTNILDNLENKKDRRINYIHQALCLINLELKNHGSCLRIHTGKPLDFFKQLMAQYEIESVYCNRDYEPYAIDRDLLQQHYLKKKTPDPGVLSISII